MKRAYNIPFVSVSYPSPEDNDCLMKKLTIVYFKRSINWSFPYVVFIRIDRHRRRSLFFIKRFFFFEPPHTHFSCIRRIV